MADMSSTYRIIAVDQLTSPATKAEAALGRLELKAEDAARGMEALAAAGRRINQAITKAMKADEGKIGAAIKAAIEQAERGPRKKKRGRGSDGTRHR